MINSPKNGWCKFNLGNFTGTPSYLTNVPVELLDAFINYWQKDYTLAVYFDEEGTDFTLVCNPYSIFIIEEKESVKLIEIDKSIKEITLELINDLENDINGWASFTYENDKKEIEAQAQMIKEKIIILKNILPI